jgi:hypothetical protein
VDTCSAAPFQFLDLDTPVAVFVAAAAAALVVAMKEYVECVAVAAAAVAVVAAMKEYVERVAVAVAAATVAEDKEWAVAATLGEDFQVAAHCVASVAGLAGGRDSVVDACEVATRVDCDVCDRAFDLSVLFLSVLFLSYHSSVRSKYIPQQRALVHRGEPL